MKFILMLISSLLCSAALADTELRFDDGSEVLIKGNRVSFSAENTSVIFPGSGNSITMVAHNDREYMIIDQGFASSVSAQMEAAMAQMESQLASMPAEQQAQMRAMLKDRMPGAKTKPAKYEFRRSGKSQEIAGFDCSHGELFKDGKKESEMCIATTDELGIPDRDVAALEAAFAAMSELVGSFAPGADQIMGLDVLGGVPIMTKDATSNQPKRLTLASFEKIDAARLTVPSDYSPTDPPGR